MKTVGETDEGNWLIHCKLQVGSKTDTCNVPRYTCRGILDDGLEHSKVLTNRRCSFS